MYGKEDHKRFQKYYPMLEALEEVLDVRENAQDIRILSSVREEEFKVEETIPRTIPELAIFFGRDKRTIRKLLLKAEIEPEYGLSRNVKLYTRAQVRKAMKFALEQDDNIPRGAFRSGRKNTLGTSVTRHRK